MSVLPRRRVLKSAGLAGVALLLPPQLLAACTTGAARAEPGREPRPHLVFSAHEASVVEEATARLIPGPADDPAETGHPGAREANVTRYIDMMLGALSAQPAAVFAGGPFSDRAGSRTDDMARFLPLTSAQTAAWSRRLSGLVEQYRSGVATLDRLAGGDFTAVSAVEKDAILATDPDRFMSLLFSHAIEGMYSVPEYGGNTARVGWTEIDFPGDVQPRGFADAQVADSDGPDRYVPVGIGELLLRLVSAAPS